MLTPSPLPVFRIKHKHEPMRATVLPVATGHHVRYQVCFCVAHPDLDVNIPVLTYTADHATAQYLEDVLAAEQWQKKFEWLKRVWHCILHLIERLL